VFHKQLFSQVVPKVIKNTEKSVKMQQNSVAVSIFEICVKYTG